MAKRSLTEGLAVLGTYVGIGTAAVVTIVETLNALFNILHNRFHFDSRALFGHLGIVGRFFERLQGVFSGLAGSMPGAEISLMFAGLSGLVAYVWYERSKMGRLHGTNLFQPLLLGITALTAAPILVSAMSIAVF